MDKYKTYRVPNWTNLEMTPDKGQMVLQYMRERCARNNTSDTPTVVAYTHGATCVANAYIGGVLNSDGSRIYFIPYSQATATEWHYIDTNGTVVPYTHGATCVVQAYYGGVLSPNGRIYMIPYNQSTATVWHYIDTDGTIKAYTHGATVVGYGYCGGVLATNGRVYLIPNAQVTATEWHYIDTDGTVVAYSHGMSDIGGSYIGGCLMPDGKIFMNPNTSYSATNWHYIDTDGSVKSYTHLTSATYWYGTALGNDGNIYAANAPFYFDTKTLNSVSITANGPNYGCVSANDGYIYYVPYGRSDEALWYRYNTALKSMSKYSHGATAVNNGYRCGILAPNGRIYLIPYIQATATEWHYIQTNITAGNDFSKNICTSPYLNKL